MDGERVLSIGENLRLLIGIRFLGGQGFPFIDIIAATEALDDARALEAVLLRASEGGLD